MVPGQVRFTPQKRPKFRLKSWIYMKKDFKIINLKLMLRAQNYYDYDTELGDTAMT